MNGMKTYVAGLLILLSSGLVVLSALPVEPVQAMVYEAADAELVSVILDEMAIEYETDADSTGDPMFRLKYLGMTIIIFMYGLNLEEKSYDSLTFVAAFAASSEQPLTLGQINDWNTAKRWGRAYLDDKGDPILEFDLRLAGGVTPKNIKKVIELFGKTALSFRYTVVWP